MSSDGGKVSRSLILVVCAYICLNHLSSARPIEARCTKAPTYTYTYTCFYTCTCIYTYTCIYTCSYIYTCTCTCTASCVVLYKVRSIVVGIYHLGIHC